MSLTIPAWIVGGNLALFLIGVMVFGPSELPEAKQRIVAVVLAMFAAIFASLFAGKLSVDFHLAETPMGNVIIRGSGGAAAFAIVLIWWLSPTAPIKVLKDQPSDLTAEIRYDVLFEGFNLHIEAPPETTLTTATLMIRAFPCTAAKLSTSRWQNILSLTAMRPKGSLSVSSSTLRAKETLNRPTTAGPGLELLRTYGDFVGEMGAFGDRGNWQKGIVTAVIEAERPQSEKWLNGLEPDDKTKKQREEHYLQEYGINDSNAPDMAFTPYPILAQIDFRVKGNSVAKLTGTLARVRRHDEDVRQPLMVYFSPYSTCPK